ncbi:MAG: ferritin family protein [Nanoarchaeota archaeon]
MTQFLIPWNVKKNGLLDDRELIRAIRQSISAEYEAAHLYEAYADATNNSLAQKVFQDIANEEKVHVGEFMSVLEQIQPKEKDWLEQGKIEVEDKMTAKINEIAKRVVRRISAKTYILKKDVRSKEGNVFKQGDKLSLINYGKKWPYVVHFEDSSGQKLGILPDLGSRYLRGFPKAPSINTMMRWTDDGVAKAIDGERVEPDGISSNGAPSWLLVLGFI